MTPLSFDLTGETLKRFEHLATTSKAKNGSHLLRYLIDQCRIDRIVAEKVSHKQFSFRLSPDLYAKLSNLAAKHTVSIGAAIRLIIDQADIAPGALGGNDKQPKGSNVANGSQRMKKTNPQKKNTMASKKPATKKAPAKKAVAKKAPVKKAVVKKAPAKKAVVKKAPAKKAVVKKAPVKKAVVKKAPAKKAPVKKAVVKKAPAKKAPAKKAPAKK
jgi:hypothetical protein